MRRLRHYSQAMALMLAIAAAGSSDAAERVYKWVDKDGVVHYGQQPPAATPSEAIKVQKGYSAPADDEPAAQKPAESAAMTQDAEFCSAAKANLEILTGKETVTRKDDKGETHVLTPDERKSEVELAKAAMARYCGASATPGTP